MLSTTVIGYYGSIPIFDDELINFKISYQTRLAKIRTTYQNPIIQYLGKDPRVLNLTFKTMDKDTLDLVWTSKNNLTGSTRNITLFGVNYGDWYLVDTKIDVEVANYQLADDGISIYYPSQSIIAVIEVMAVK